MLPKSVLIVDDSEPIRELIFFFLRENGFIVHEAEDGLNALSTLNQLGGVDLIITDLRMPRLGGLDFIKRVKESYPSTPLLVMSADGGRHLFDEARALGVKECIAKPFSMQTLLSLVYRYTGS